MSSPIDVIPNMNTLRKGSTIIHPRALGSVQCSSNVDIVPMLSEVQNLVSGWEAEVGVRGEPCDVSGWRKSASSVYPPLNVILPPGGPDIRLALGIGSGDVANLRNAKATSGTSGRSSLFRHRGHRHLILRSFKYVRYCFFDPS